MSEVVSELIDRLNEYRSMGDKFYPEDIVITEDIWLLIDEIERLHFIIKEVREYIEKDTRWFDSEYAKTYGELCTCAGANDTRLEVLVNPSNLLEILDKENK